MSVARSVRSLPPSGTSRAAVGVRRMQRPMAAASEPSENLVRQTRLVGGLRSAVRAKKSNSASSHGPRCENCCSEAAKIANAGENGALNVS